MEHDALSVIIELKKYIEVRNPFRKTNVTNKIKKKINTLMHTYCFS